MLDINIARSQNAAQRASHLLSRCPVVLTEKAPFQVLSEIDFSKVLYQFKFWVLSKFDFLSCHNLFLMTENVVEWFKKNIWVCDFFFSHFEFLIFCFTFWVFFSHIFSFWFVTFWVCEFCHVLSFWVVTFWVFEFCHILMFEFFPLTFWVFGVMSHFEFF